LGGHACGRGADRSKRDAREQKSSHAARAPNPESKIPARPSKLTASVPPCQGLPVALHAFEGASGKKVTLWNYLVISWFCASLLILQRDEFYPPIQPPSPPARRFAVGFFGRTCAACSMPIAKHRNPSAPCEAQSCTGRARSVWPFSS